MPGRCGTTGEVTRSLTHRLRGKDTWQLGESECIMIITSILKQEELSLQINKQCLRLAVCWHRGGLTYSVAVSEEDQHLSGADSPDGRQAVPLPDVLAGRPRARPGHVLVVIAQVVRVHRELLLGRLEDVEGEVFRQFVGEGEPEGVSRGRGGPAGGSAALRSLWRERHRPEAHLLVACATRYVRHMIMHGSEGSDDGMLMLQQLSLHFIFKKC